MLPHSWSVGSIIIKGIKVSNMQETCYQTAGVLKTSALCQTTGIKWAGRGKRGMPSMNLQASSVLCRARRGVVLLLIESEPEV